jgi:hypothetical protein
MQKSIELSTYILMGVKPILTLNLEILVSYKTGLKGPVNFVRTNIWMLIRSLDIPMIEKFVHELPLWMAGSYASPTNEDGIEVGRQFMDFMELCLI